MESLRVDFVGVWPRSGSSSHLLALVRYADGPQFATLWQGCRNGFGFYNHRRRVCFHLWTPVTFLRLSGHRLRQPEPAQPRYL